MVGPENAPITAPVLRVGNSHVVFEWFRPAPPVRLSQIVQEFRLRRNGHVVFAGSGTITDIVDLETTQLCEVQLAEPGIPHSHSPGSSGLSPSSFEAFLAEWQESHKVPHDFKLACLDLYSFLTELKATMAVEEMRLKLLPPKERVAAETLVLSAWSPGVVAGISQYHEAYELAAAQLDEKTLWPAVALVRRLLSPFFLVAPFGHRTFYKPLGYAGDFEMMGMIMRNGFEGETIFAKLVHHWLVQQWAALSVRNRISHLEQRLRDEAARAMTANHRFKVLDIGCGPAWEVQNYIRANASANKASFTLVDFDKTAVDFVRRATAEANSAARRTAEINVVQLSVNQLIKESLRTNSAPLGRDFDFVYCVGLFDYLPVRMCQQLTQMFYDWTVPGGLVAVANMKDEKPYRHMVEHLLDWHLIYRSAKDIEKFLPALATSDEWRVVGEDLAINLFLEIRKSK